MAVVFISMHCVIRICKTLFVYNKLLTELAYLMSWLGHEKLMAVMGERGVPLVVFFGG